jgi:hypothetical protein
VRSSQGWGLRQCCHKSNYQAVGWFDGWLVGWKPTIKLTNQQTFPESLSSYPQKDKGGNCASPVERFPGISHFSPFLLRINFCQPHDSRGRKN